MADSIAHFVDALNVLNANTASLAATLAEVKRVVETKPAAAPPAPVKVEPDEQEQDEDFWESSQAASQVSKIVGGEFNSATILHDLREVEKKIADVTHAQEMGIISFRDAVGALAGLGMDYASLKAVAAGKALGGQAGAKLAKAVASAPRTAASATVSQITGVVSGAAGLLGGTALGGGLFGLLLHGIKEADRLAAEAGEITNIFSAAGTTVTSGAAGHFAAFQETAQTFYGVSRQEVQGVLKEFLLAGVSIEEIMAGGRAGIGIVGHDVVTLSLGMDKLFELSGGFTSQQAMKLVREQGLGVGDAVDRITKVEMLAHRAHTSVAGFTSEAVSAATELRDYGVRVDSVAVGMQLLQEKFKDIGLNAQSAMEYSQQGVKEITSGLKGAGLGMQGLLSQQLGYGGDSGGASLSGRYEMMDKLQGGDQEEFVRVVKALHGVSAEQTEGTYGGSDEVRQREYLERQGFGLMGSKAIYTVGMHIESGQKIDDISKEEWVTIRKAFKVEGSKISELEKNSAKFSKALARMGQGMLFTITNFFALMIISVKTIMSVDWRMEAIGGMIKSTIGETAGVILRKAADATGLSTTTEADTQEVLSMFRAQWGATAKSAGNTYTAMGDSLGALNDIVKPLIHPILMAMDFKVGGDMSETMDDATAEAEGLKTLTPEFWQAFEEMCKRQGVDPGEMRKMLGAEHGFRIWGSHRVNYRVDKQGKYKIDPATGKRIQQAKGMGAWVWATAHASGMSRDEWDRLEYMPAMEQLRFLEKTMRMMGVRGLNAAALHVKWMGAGFMKSNPHHAIAVADWWWSTPDGIAFLEGGGKRVSSAVQNNNYIQNAALDWEKKGYLTAADLQRTTDKCPKCGKAVINCKCPKPSVVSVTVERTSSGPEVTVTMPISVPVGASSAAIVEASRPTIMMNPSTSMEYVDKNLADALSTTGFTGGSEGIGR